MTMPVAGADSSGSSTSSPASPTSKQSYAGTAWQYLYNAKAAVSAALRKDIHKELDPRATIHALGTAGVGEEWLLQRCRSVQYFSYRNKLPLQIGPGLDHDAGWGCMVRTGQMMLCAALYRSVRLMHGGGGGGGGGAPSPAQNLSTAAFRDGENLHTTGGSNLGNGTSNVDKARLINDMLLMFRDAPNAVFSIYGIVTAGAKFHIAPGEWFNATSLALSLQHLILARPNVPITAVHGRESTVELHEVLGAIALGKPVLVMVSVMLGMNNIAKTYFGAVHECLGHPMSVGIVGGKPKKSMYFFASQKETLFMLDPHYVQPAFTSLSSVGQFAGTMDWIPMAEADSSMLACFLIEPTEDAVESWAAWVETVLPTLSEYPMFCISRRKNACVMRRPAKATAAGATASATAAVGAQPQRPPPQQPLQQPAVPRAPAPHSGDDDFEFLDADDDDDFCGVPPALPPSRAAKTRLDSATSSSSSAGRSPPQATAGLATLAAYKPPAPQQQQQQQQPRAQLAQHGIHVVEATIDDDVLLGVGTPPTRQQTDGLLSFDDL